MIGCRCESALLEVDKLDKRLGQCEDIRSTPRILATRGTPLRRQHFVIQWHLLVFSSSSFESKQFLLETLPISAKCRRLWRRQRPADRSAAPTSFKGASILLRRKATTTTRECFSFSRASPLTIRRHLDNQHLSGSGRFIVDHLTFSPRFQLFQCDTRPLPLPLSFPVSHLCFCELCIHGEQHEELQSVPLLTKCSSLG